MLGQEFVPGWGHRKLCPWPECREFRAWALPEDMCLGAPPNNRVAGAPQWDWPVDLSECIFWQGRDNALTTGRGQREDRERTGGQGESPHWLLPRQQVGIRDTREAGCERQSRETRMGTEGVSAEDPTRTKHQIPEIFRSKGAKETHHTENKTANIKQRIYKTMSKWKPKI